MEHRTLAACRVVRETLEETHPEVPFTVLPMDEFIIVDPTEPLPNDSIEDLANIERVDGELVHHSSPGNRVWFSLET